MFTENEIYFLNSALDDESIYGLKPKEEIAITPVSAEVARKSLIKKKVLNEDMSINNTSYLILKNLEQYKNSKSYIWINDIVASIDESNYLIMFNKNEDEIEFKKTTKELMLLGIVKQYEFTWPNIEIEEKNQHIPVNFFILERLSKVEDEDVIYVKREDDGKVTSYNVYYKEGNLVYKYNVLNEELTIFNPKNIRLEIATALGIKVGA